MTPDLFLSSILDPGLAWVMDVLGSKPPVNDQVRVLLLAIAGVETAWQNIAQSGGGPGRSPYQFESETILELLQNPITKAMANKVCAAAHMLPTYYLIYQNLIANPNMATAFARLDLWADPAPLPAVGDTNGAFLYYVACWRPGAVTEGGARAVAARLRWNTTYAEARAALTRANA